MQLDTRKHLVSCRDDAEEAKHLWQNEKARIRRDSAELIDAAETKSAERTGVSVENFRKMRDGGVIMDPDFRITLMGENRTITVGEILKDPKKWNETKIPDPLEPDYDGGRQVAIIYTTGQPTIVSQAHGGRKLTLMIPTGAISPSNRAAEHLLRRHDGHFLYDPAQKRWAFWDGSEWAFDDGREIRLAAKAELITMAEEVFVESDGKTRPAWDTQNMIRAVEQILRDAFEQTSFTDWDQQFEFIGVPSGVVDLRTGELRAATPEDKITKKTGVQPVPGLTPIMDKFLDEITEGDAHFVSHIWRFFGYAISGDPSAHVFPFITGPGGNGKSVLVSVLQHIIGEYGIGLMPNTLTEQAFQSNSADFDMMRFSGARVAFVSEIPKNKTWNEAAIKNITGGDTITARAAGKDPVTFRSIAVPIPVGNDVPSLRGVGEAMRRRLKIWRFTFAPKNPDRDLVAKILKNEAEAILARVIEEAKAWRISRELLIPKCVEAASADYLTEEDTLGEFLRLYCEVGAGFEVGSKELFDRYRGFADEAGYNKKQTLQNVTAFGRELKNRGFEVRSGRTRNYRQGLRLRTLSPDEAERIGVFEVIDGGVES